MAIDENLGASQYTYILKKLRDALLSDKNINTVTVGDIGDIDLDKMTLFPLGHIVVTNATIVNSVINYEVQILLMDIVHNDITRTDATQFIDPVIFEDDNELYVLNTMLNIGNRLTDDFANGSLYDGNYFIERSSVSCQPFSDRFENQLAGWSFNFTLTVRNNIDRCNTGS